VQQWTQSRQRADGNGKKDPIRKEGSGAGSGSVHQTNGSRSGRPKTCRSGSGFPTPPIRSHLILYRSELPVATAHAHIWPWHHELPRQGGGQTGRGCREQWAAGIPTHPPYLTITKNKAPRGAMYKNKNVYRLTSIATRMSNIHLLHIPNITHITN